ncbi:hypothetical protein EAO69_08620 [Streptomyces sp. me109]|uniref:hypothetical protein n=1 Tax=Streptomyces sp. me109 TaxID=1827853 RepID=UPI0011CDEAF4|nr:hypothetical protein [Streptomyces sp. me109]TXS76469.1 hypothetical protein EAO69_08620 [Streptomyces sp. me109]
MLAGAGLLVGVAAAPAQAAGVSYATRCVPPAASGLDPVEGTTEVQITAPAAASVGDEVEVVWKFTRAASKNPDLIDLPADSVQPSGTLKAAGAQTADLAMRGPRENPAIPKGGAMVLSDMKGTLKLTAPGTGTAQPTGSASASPGDSGGQTDFTGKEVPVAYACKTPIGDKNATSPVQIDARRNGGGFDLTVRFKKSVMDSPADIPADSVKPSMEVVLGGADKGTVHVEGPANAQPIKSGDPIEIPDLTGTYKPGASGRSTLAPGVLTVAALGTTTTCTPATSEVSLTLDTTRQEGGASGGGGSAASGGTSSGSASTSGGLAETGSDSGGALEALGLVAGTVILLGGAVFTFLPRRHPR